MSNAISHTAFLDFFNDGTYPSIRQQFSTHNFKAKYRSRTRPSSAEIVIELLVQDQMTHQTSSISIGYPWHWVLDKKTKISEFRMIDIPKKNQSLNRFTNQYTGPQFWQFWYESKNFQTLGCILLLNIRKTYKYCENTREYCTCRWWHFSSIGSILVSITTILTSIVTIFASIEQVNTPLVCTIIYRH